MITGTHDIITHGDQVFVLCSSLLTNALTFLWGCAFLGICILIIWLYPKNDKPVPSTIQLTFFSGLMALISWGVVCIMFLPATLNVKIPKPHIGLAISFLMFAIFVFLTLRRKENCPLWLKIVSFILPAPLPLLAAGFAGISTYLVLLLSWPVLRDLMILYLFLFVGYEFCSLVIANVALKYETQRSEKEWPN